MIMDTSSGPFQLKSASHKEGDVTLQSQLFNGDAKLQAPLYRILRTSRRARLVSTSREIQLALNQLDRANLSPDGIYGFEPRRGAGYKQTARHSEQSLSDDCGHIVRQDDDHGALIGKCSLRRGANVLQSVNPPPLPTNPPPLPTQVPSDRNIIAFKISDSTLVGQPRGAVLGPP